MEIQPTPELKARFFAQYYGQLVLDWPKSWHTAYVDNNLTEWRINNGWLRLKPLSSITDENAIEIAEILELRKYSHQFTNQGLTICEGDWDSFNHYYISELGEVEFCNVDFYKSVEVCQYLQSKGYALPFMGIQVETLIEWGWVKLVS